ncbi:MAG: hypothetical protein V1891_04980 [bacterium]
MENQNNKPLLRNYLMFSLFSLLFLALIYFPKLLPSYEAWLNNKSVVPIVIGRLFLVIPLIIAEFIGNVFYIFSIFVAPTIIFVFLVKKYIYKEEGKFVFLKLPVLMLFFSEISSFLAVYSSMFGNLCSGEECMINLVMIFALPIFWVIISIIVSVIVYATNKKNGFLREKILFKTKSKIFRNFFIVLSAVLCILFLIKISNFRSSFDEGDNLKEGKFFEEFPDLPNLRRWDVRIYSGTTTWDVFGVQNYKTVYYQNYSTCLDNNLAKNYQGIKHLEVIIVEFDSFNELVSSLNKADMSIIDGVVKYNGGEIEGEQLLENISGCVITKIDGKYFWIDKDKNYFIEVKTNLNENIANDYMQILVGKFRCK